MPINNIPEEIETLAKKLVKDPASRLFLPLAEKYRDAGMLEEAEKVLRDGLVHHPDYVGAIFSLGRVLHEKGDADGAFGKFKEVVKSAPDNLLAHKKLAEIALKKDLIPEALESLRMIVRLDPSDEKTQELIKKYDAPKAAPAASAAGAPEFESFETSCIAAEPPSTPKPDESSWLSGPDQTETMPEVAVEPLSAVSAEGVSLTDMTDEGGGSIDLMEFSAEPGTVMESPAESLLPEEEKLLETGPTLDSLAEDSAPVSVEPELLAPETEAAEDGTPEIRSEIEQVTTEGPSDDAYQLPPVEEIELDKDLGIEVPTTLTPVEGQLETDYSWQEPVSLEPAKVAPEEEKPVPVHEIVDEEESPSAAIIAPPAPDESLQQLFSEIVGDSAPATDVEPGGQPEEQHEEEIETETVAELYIQQGLYEKAREIYDRLLLKTPGNSNIRQKLEEIQFLINLIGQKDQS